MNYFPFDPDPRLSAIALDDKRLPRVFGEAVMVLSKAQYLLTGTNGPYSPGIPVPRALIDWVVNDGENWFCVWVQEMRQALLERNGTERVEGYACTRAYGQLAERFRNRRQHVCPECLPMSFPNLARAAIKGLDFSTQTDTHDAYRNYMRAQWNGIDKRPNVWTHHGPPVWFEPALPQGIMEFLGV